MIVIDVGNTDTVLAIFDRNKKLLHLRLRSNATEGKVFYAFHLQNAMLENNIDSSHLQFGIFSSVVPSMNNCISELLHDFTQDNYSEVKPGMLPLHKVKIDQESELGADLYANSVAAYRLTERPCIIIDFGTALTFTAVDYEGSILGVAITPGIGTAIKSLFSHTAQLPEVPIHLPTSVVGTNTINSIQSGVLHGYEGLIKHLIHKFKEILGQEAKVVATGGLSQVVSFLNPCFDHKDIDLTINGIRQIGEELGKSI